MVLNKQEALGASGEASQQRMPPRQVSRLRILLEGPRQGPGSGSLDLILQVTAVGWWLERGETCRSPVNKDTNGLGQQGPDEAPAAAEGWREPSGGERIENSHWGKLVHSVQIEVGAGGSTDGWHRPAGIRESQCGTWQDRCGPAISVMSQTKPSTFNHFSHKQDVPEDRLHGGGLGEQS